MTLPNTRASDSMTSQPSLLRSGQQQLRSFVLALFDLSFTAQISSRRLLPLLYALLVLSISVLCVSGVISLFYLSVLWGTLALLAMPVLLITITAICRVLIEFLLKINDIKADIAQIAGMRESIDHIAKMAEPIASISDGIHHMSDSIDVIAQMRHALYEISSATSHLTTIASMQPAMQKIAEITENISNISEMKDALQRLSTLGQHIETIASMKDSIGKIAMLTDNLEIIADMSESIDKISEIGDIVAKLRRAPFMR
jgi:methyl-accepting chemotaxis protein